jgi:hypothetical protein
MGPIGEKNYTVAYISLPKESSFKRAVSWYRDSLSAHPTALKILNCLLGGVIVFGTLGLALPLVCKISDLAFRADQERAAKKFYG